MIKLSLNNFNSTSSYKNHHVIRLNLWNNFIAITLVLSEICYGEKSLKEH